MAIERITIGQFLQLSTQYPILDVRSPGEYKQAHIPGAHNLALFSDAERKEVGTLYKQTGKSHAVKSGLHFFGSKMVPMLEQAEAISRSNAESQGKKAGNDQAFLVHCWRGGMRSAGVAWLLDLYGFKVYTLTGGYKAFRRWSIQQFDKEYPFQVVGGYTGSGKTDILARIRERGQTIIDLEKLASHKGSVFGGLGEPAQPSQEMFENRLALALSAAAHAETIWLEDESQRIGDVNIPIHLYRQIQTRPLFFLQVPFDNRLDYLVKRYGQFEKERLANGIMRLKKRLGGLETKTALEHLEAGSIRDSFDILLKYYDKYYLKSLHNKAHLVQEIRKLDCQDADTNRNAEMILKGAEITTY